MHDQIQAHFKHNCHERFSFLFRSGNEQHKEDRFKDTVIEVHMEGTPDDTYKKVGEFDGDDRDQTFAEIVARWVRVFFFEDPGALCVAVERAGERGFESLAVGTAVDVVDVVGGLLSS